MLPKSLTLQPLLEELDGEFPLFLLNFLATLGDVDDLPPYDDDDEETEEESLDESEDTSNLLLR